MNRRVRRRGSKVVVEVLPSSLVRVARARPLLSNHDWSDADASYVVAGGMGDLGRRLLLLMARRGAMHLVTLSRRVVTPEDRDAFQTQLELVRPGCRLVCLPCDVTLERSVQAAAAALERLGLPAVRGVVQCAVLLQDHTLETMTFDDFHAVTAAKVYGTLALEKAFSSPRLRFFLMLSSAVNITGASGQANYNAGNAVQDALAHGRERGFVSLNVGWIEGAVNTANDKTKLQGLWRTGLQPVLPEELSSFFDHVLGEATSDDSPLRQAVIGFNAASLAHTSASNSNVQSPLFAHARGFGSGAVAEQPSTATLGRLQQSLDEIAQSSSPEAAVDYICTAIASQLASLIAVDGAQVVNHGSGSILELGLDSLVAIELRNGISRQFRAPLQTSEILTDQTLRQLVQKVAARSLLLTGKLDGAGVGTNAAKQGAISHQIGFNAAETATTVFNGDAANRKPEAIAVFRDRIADRQLGAGTVSATPIPRTLPPLPILPLEQTLQLFEESRRAINTADNQRATRAAVHDLLHGAGPQLHDRLV
ncbi:hypothetical protein LLEC1_07428, partial [Akanthomyces lecanii]